MTIFAQNLAKTCKKTDKFIFTSVWSEQHPNSGKNLQQVLVVH